MAKQWYITFNYDDSGRGSLKLHNDSLLPIEVPARSGSIKRGVGLVNVIYPGVWTIRDVPELTVEKGMVWKGDIGWKVRLWTPKGNRSRYLIHPDGDGKGLGKKGNGTAGCIGLQEDGELLKDRLYMILNKQQILPVYVNTPVPEEVV